MTVKDKTLKNLQEIPGVGKSINSVSNSTYK